MKFRIIAALLAAAAALFSGCSSASGTRHTSGSGEAQTIASKDLVSFDCEFYTTNLCDYNGKPYYYCHFTLVPEDGVCLCTASVETSGGSFDVSFDAPADALTRLQAVIDGTGFAACNGHYGYTDGLPGRYGGSVTAEYASGETLKASDNASVPFSDAIKPLCGFFEALAADAGRSWLTPEETGWTSDTGNASG